MSKAAQRWRWGLGHVRRASWGLACVATLTSLPRAAAADDAKPAPSSATVAGAASVRRIRSKKPTPPPGPSADAASATLHVTPAALGTPWTFELTNTDTTPLRLVMDGRLLTLDVLPPDAPHAEGDESEDAKPVAPHVSAKTGHPRAGKRVREIHCALPSEVRPETDDGHARILPPGYTYVEEFDPRLYCFDGYEAAALVPGTRVVARLGWTPPRKGPVAPPAQKVVVSAPARVDAETGRDLLVDVTVTNATSRPIRLMLRPETLAFEIESPRGIFQCAWRTHPGAPIAEVFKEIPPHGEVSANVLLSSVCPDEALQSAGLYTVLARLDTRHASGKAIGIDTFDGRVEGVAPTLVRIRRDHERRP